jgi:hypothetical protein
MIRYQSALQVIVSVFGLKLKQQALDQIRRADSCWIQRLDNGQRLTSLAHRGRVVNGGCNFFKRKRQATVAVKVVYNRFAYFALASGYFKEAKLIT